MSYLEYHAKSTPTGLRKILFLNWPLVLLLSAAAGVGFLMLYSMLDRFNCMEVSP